MHLRHGSDPDFEQFIRERKRVKARHGGASPSANYENQALRELEQVEQREFRDQQLSREVHDFFAAATRQAAAIVEKVAQDAEQEAGARIEAEVTGFLMDSLTRMNSFIASVMRQRRNANVAETQVEPHVGHIVGTDLDNFRWEGTSDVRDAHIGQDPFDVEVEQVQREFRAAMGELEPEPTPIEEHLVAESAAVETEPEPPAAPTRQPAARAKAVPKHDEIVAAAREAEAEPRPTREQELETFKNALKALVRQGIMQREEAKAAWQARLATLGGRA